MLKKHYSMDPTQQPPSQPQTQPQPQPQMQSQSAESYYNNQHKHGFQFSRATLIGSMCILLIALTFNVLALYSQNTSTLQSRASGPVKTEQVLPQLPSGCTYEQIKGGMAVVCPKATPTEAPPVPINITLPKLPPQCSWQTTPNGNKVSCGTAAVPIPTVPVTLPTQCSATNQNNVVSCKNAANQNVTVPLPSLPDGCLYALIAGNYYVVCEGN